MEKIDELLDMKKEMEDLKIKKAKIQGKQEEFEKFFKEELGVFDEESIEREIVKLREEYNLLSKKFGKDFDALKRAVEGKR